MSVTIRIRIAGVEVGAEVSDTACAREFLRILPIEATPREWGDEFYFAIPVQVPLDATATTSVKVGDIGYWPPGNALAIFFGPTPMSTDERPVPASAVNIVGHITGDATVLRNARGSRTIRVERE